MDDSRGSRVEPIRGRPNAGTMVLPGDADPRLASSAIAAAWSTLVPALSLISAREAIGYRIFWNGCGETGFRDFYASDRDAHLIVGRHALADVVLGGDAELSLRHLLVVPAASERGGPAIRLVDLRASAPMFLDDDTAQRALRAEGPFAVRIGRYVLGGFPIGPGQGHPPRDLARADRRDATQGEPAGDGPYRGGAGRSASVITIMPRPITMVDSVGSHAGDAVGVLAASREGREVRVPLRAADLRAGVLVGRADKCDDQGLRPLLTIRVSRVHAELIRVEGRTMLYDCASTNGTFVHGRKVRSVELTREGPVVQLAGREGIELRWTPLREGQ